MQPPEAHAAKQGGFTLIEMLVVLAVLGLMIALVASRGPQRSAGLDLRGTAGDMAQALRFARSQAIVSNREVMFIIDTQERSFRVGHAPPRTLPPGLGISVVAVADLAERGLAGIAFTPDGGSTGGRVELSRGESRMQVGVDWLTGRVSVSDGP